MNHQHLPALNRYTSPNQYEALQQIGKTHSLTPLLMKGSMSKTVGALIRSAWIASNNFTDEAGVLREGWAVTDAGRHAMQIYEAKLDEQRKLEERRIVAANQRKFAEELLHQGAVLCYRAEMERDKRERECAQLANELVGLIPPVSYRLRLKEIYESARRQVNQEYENARKQAQQESEARTHTL